jgi:hypothetical protein
MQNCTYHAFRGLGKAAENFSFLNQRELIMALIHASVILDNCFVQNQLYRTAVHRNPDRAFFKAALVEQRLELLTLKRKIKRLNAVLEQVDFH